MKLTEEIKNRMIAMVDYISARSVEFGGINIHLSIEEREDAGMHASVEFGNIFTDGIEYHRLIGTGDDGSWFSGWRDLRYATEKEVLDDQV